MHFHIDIFLLQKKLKGKIATYELPIPIYSTIHGSSGPEISGFGPEMGVFGHIFKFQS